MYQTGYTGITTFSWQLPFLGGLTEWWYTPRDNINTFPAIDPATQFLASEPTLKTGKAWYGPVRVPDDQLGFEEPVQRNAIGILYKQKVSGFYPGDDQWSRINLENMPYYEYVIIGRVRAGGFFLVLGNDKKGMQFDADFSIGNGAIGTAGAKFAFSQMSMNKGLLMLSFSESPNIAPPGFEPCDGITNIVVAENDVEVIPFTSSDFIKTIDWTPGTDFPNRFGKFPEIQVWTNADGMIAVPIAVDAPPPDQTLFTVSLPGQDGWIVIK
jgi:hypothetical protein